MKPSQVVCALLLLFVGWTDLLAQRTSPKAIVPSFRALDVVFGGENLNMGPSAGLQFVSRYVNLGVTYSMHSTYMDRTKSDAADNALSFPTTAINNTRAIEAGAQLNLFSWSDDQDFEITDEIDTRISDPDLRGRYTVTTTRYYRIEQFPSRMFIGVRGGYFEWNTPISSATKPDTDPLLSTEGVQLGRTGISQYMDVFTNVRTKSFYAGLAYSYFVYDANRYQTYYADVFFSSRTQFDPIVLGNYAFDIEGPGSSGFPVRKTGYRVGVDVFVSGVSARAEFGIRPGSYGGYVLLGGGIALPLWWW